MKREQVHLRYRGRPNRKARKRARAVWEPAPSGGRSTTMFTRRLDPWRPEIYRVGQEVMRLTQLVEAEAPRAAKARTDLGRMNFLEAKADLGEACVRYLGLLDRGRKRPAGLPTDRLQDELERVARRMRAIDVGAPLRLPPPSIPPRIFDAALEAGRRSQPWLLPPAGALRDAAAAPKGPGGRPIPTNLPRRKT